MKQTQITKLNYVILALAASLGLSTVRANERLFGYTYEPETMPKGGWEVENWITSRLGRNSTVGQQRYQRWEFRQEFEYGVTDNYTVSLYVNWSQTSFKDSATGRRTSDFKFDGISLENRYLVLNPAEHAVGLALYLEPRFSGPEFELEQKIILGQRHGDWKWALNLTHATEWSGHFRETEGEVEVSLGVSRNLGKHWSVGIEARDHNELPEYERWENTALYLGPVINYRRGNWSATLSVLPQIFGVNFGENPDRNTRLDLKGHERWNIRLIVGFGF